MAYLTNDKSVHDGHPVELYKFEGPSASLTYYYTNHESNISFGGNTYTSVVLMRSSISGAGITDTADLSVDMPMNLSLVQVYAFNTPPRSLTLTVYRYHLGDESNWVVYWTGPVTSIRIVGSTATVRSASILEDAMRTEIPTARFQGLCCHKLYDDRCSIAAEDYDHSTTVSSFGGDTVTVASDDGKDDNWFRGGMIVRDTDGEKRLILDHTGLVLTLSHAFRSLSITDAVTLYAGCDHTVVTCKTKFVVADATGNVENFGGFPHMPGGNPVSSGWHGV